MQWLTPLVSLTAAATLAPTLLTSEVLASEPGKNKAIAESVHLTVDLRKLLLESLESRDDAPATIENERPPPPPPRESKYAGLNFFTTRLLSDNKVYRGSEIDSYEVIGNGTEETSQSGEAELERREKAPLLSDQRRGKGETVRVPSYSEVVAVGNGRSYYCTGVQIAPQVVLTAAHCLPSTRVTARPDLGEKGGSAAIKGWKKAPSHVDLALMELETPLKGSTILPLFSLDTPLNGEGMVVGFGSDHAQGLSAFGKKLKGGVSFMDPQCTSSREKRFGCLPGVELLVASGDGTDTCDGDSGGPLYALTAEGRVLVGITSRPLPSPGRRCGAGGIYVNIQVLSGWIKDELSKIEARRKNEREHDE